MVNTKLIDIYFIWHPTGCCKYQLCHFYEKASEVFLLTWNCTSM